MSGEGPGGMEEGGLFQEEERLLVEAEALCRSGRDGGHPLFDSYRALVGNYRKLLEHSRKLVRIGDAQERQLPQRTGDLGKEKRRSDGMLAALTNMGRSLSLEKDHDQLLHKILMLSKEITGADAGSIFTVEEDQGGEKRLLFRYTHTFSKNLPYETKHLPCDVTSIAGYVAVTGKVLNIADVYQLDPDLPFRFNADFDRQYEYTTGSMLVVPMRDHIDRIIGVIQLINCKSAQGVLGGDAAYGITLATPQDFAEHVVPFAESSEGLLEAAASQAAIALENNRMIRRIEEVFDQFVKASVAAIESRDPPTSGHSFRVAMMSVETARVADAQESGPFAEVRFSETAIKEIEMAGLLHDFGKIYIDSDVFLKAKRLYPMELEHLMLRLQYIHRSLTAAPQKQLLLERIMRTVSDLNEPAAIGGERDDLLREIAGFQEDLACEDLEGRAVPLLTDHEMRSLGVSRGTLNLQDREIIESHVDHTYNFAQKIPWPAEYRGIPEIVLKHHEKLDGSGYPQGVAGDDIPLEARILTIADMFDALHAADRPYKKAVPLERVFEVLREEAAAGRLDPDLLELFVTAEVYRVCY